MKRLTALTLALLMLLSLLVSCADSTPEQPDVTTTEAQEEQTSVTNAITTDSLYDENGYLKDNIPEDTDFGNQEISILYWQGAICAEFEADGITAEDIPDAVFHRNEKVQQRLGVELKWTGIAGNNANMSTYIQAVTNDIGAGSASEFDIFASYSMVAATLATSGYTEDLMQYDEYLDFSMPWWPENLISQATVNDRLYFASGDISTNLLYYMFVLFFNKELITQYNRQDPYELVSGNGWTVDKFVEICTGINGGDVTDNAKYGFVSLASVWLDPFFFASGQSTIEKDSNGDMVISDTWNSEKTINLCTKLCRFLHVSGDAKIGAGKDEDREMLTTERTVFIADSAGSAITFYSEHKLPLGVVPYPKYDKDQKDYYTTVGFTYTMYMISAASQSKTESAATLECLASEAFRGTSPTVFEMAFKSKYSESKDEGPMWDIIKGSISFDLGRIYSSSLGKYTYSLFRNTLMDNEADSWSTSFGKAQDQIKGYLNDIKASFAAIGG